MSESSTQSPPAPDLADETDEMIRKIDVSIDELTRKIEEGRVRDCEKERVRIKRHRALANALKTRSDLVEQRELQELHEKVNRLKQTRSRGRR